MNREAIKCSTLIRQRIYPPCVEALEGIAARLGSRTGSGSGFEAREFGIGTADLRRGVDGGEDHVAMFEDVVD